MHKRRLFDCAADGQVSRLSVPEAEEDGRSSGSRSGSSTVRLSFDQGYDINSKLRLEVIFC